MDKIAIIAKKPELDNMVNEMPSQVNKMWKHRGRLDFEYLGVPNAIIIIPYSEDSWRKGYLEFGGVSSIKALDKEYLSVEERQMILQTFYEELLLPFCKENNIKIICE